MILMKLRLPDHKRACDNTLPVPAHDGTARAEYILFAFAIWTTGILCIKFNAAINTLRCISLTLGFLFVNLESPHEFVGISPQIVNGDTIILLRFGANSHYSESFIAYRCHSLGVIIANITILWLITKWLRTFVDFIFERVGYFVTLRYGEQD